MNEKTLKSDNITVNKKELHKSKKTINSDLRNIDQIVKVNSLRGGGGGGGGGLAFHDSKV